MHYQLLVPLESCQGIACTFRYKIWAEMCGITRFRVESSVMLDHLVDASIKTMKYLKSPLGGFIGP